MNTNICRHVYVPYTVVLVLLFLQGCGMPDRKLETEPRSTTLLFSERGFPPDGTYIEEAHNDRVRKVKINTNVFTKAELSIPLMDGTSVVAQRQRTVHGKEKAMTWIGEIKDHPGSTVTLTKNKGVITGVIRFGAEHYEITHSTNGDTLYYQIDRNTFPADCDFAPTQESSDYDQSATDNVVTTMAALEADDSFVVIDLMVAYTQASMERWGKDVLEARIINAVQSANQALINSVLQIRINLVHMANVHYVETGRLGEAVFALRSPNDGKMDEIHEWRDTYGADIVTVVSEDSDGCGFGFIPGIGSFGSSWGFNAVYSQCLTSRTLVHEIAHNMGSAHNVENAGNSGVSPYSHGHRRCATDGTGFATVMSYHCSGASRINYFSNPDLLSEDGFPLGIDGTADNVRSITENAPTIAAYRSNNDSTNVPAAPTNMTVTAISTSQIDIRWRDQSTDEQSFSIERSTSGSSWQTIGSVQANVTIYSDTGLPPASTWHYRVRAYNSSGASAYSNVDSATTLEAVTQPVAPTGLIVDNVSESSIRITWNDNSSNETGFRIQRSTDQTAWSLIVTVPEGTTSYNNTGLSANTTYFYRVYAYNTAGNSSYSPVVSATTAAAIDNLAPTVPAGLIANNVTHDQVALSWQASTDNVRVVGYRVFRNGSLIKTTTLVTYSDPNVTPDTQYLYAIQAYDAAGNHSAKSSSLGVVTLSEPQTVAIPIPPNNLTAKASTSSEVSLNWLDQSNNESGFRIERSLSGSSWSLLATLGADVTTYKDTLVTAQTTYYYRVRAYNSAGDSVYATVNVTTPAETQEIDLRASGYKVRGRQQAQLSWSGVTTTSVSIIRNGTQIKVVPNTGSHVDQIGKKGKGSYVYQICESETSHCSNTARVKF